MSNDQTLTGNPAYLNALESERVIRAAAYVMPTERIAEFTAVLITLPQWTKLRLVNSPLLPPFGPTTDVQLAQFLWIVSPEFTPVPSRAKNKFFKRCRAFTTPPRPMIPLPWLVSRWERRAGQALAKRTRILFAARDYMREAFQDSRRGEGPPAIEYYGDETAITSRLGRAYGWAEEKILKMALKKIFPHLKEIQERECLEHGVRPLLENASEDVIDQMLATANAKN